MLSKITLETSRKVDSTTCKPFTSPFGATPKYKIPFSCLFNIATMSFIASCISLVLFLNSSSSVSCPKFIISNLHSMISTIVYQNQGQMSRQNVSYIVPFVLYVKIIVDLVIKAYLRKISKNT